MKTGKTLTELAQEIERQAKSKRDFVINTEAVEALTTGTDVALRVGDNQFPINDHAHRQIGARLGIRADYYDRMRTKAPALLAANVNTWLHQEPEKRLVRVLDGRVRAFVSDGFPLDRDNIDLAKAILPVIANLGVEVLSADITPTRLYLKVVDKRILRDLPSGKLAPDGHKSFDTVSPALVLSNSEIGLGSSDVVTSVYWGGCTNLAVFRERSIRKYHIGAKHKIADGNGVEELFSEKTKQLTSAAFFSQVRDVVQGAFDQAKFDALVDEIKGTAERKIEGNVQKIVEVTAERFGMNEEQEGSVLKFLIQGGDLTQYGLANAVTRAAQDVADYDTASGFEEAGGKIIDLREAEWEEILKEAA